LIVIFTYSIIIIDVKIESKHRDYQKAVLLSEIIKMRSIVDEMRVENTKQAKMIIEREIKSKNKND